MKTDTAAPCRHAGSPPREIIERVAEVIQGLVGDPEFLERRGLTVDEFRTALPAAIQTVRGRMSAENSERRGFLEGIFNAMLTKDLISGYEKPKYGNRTVHQLVTAEGREIAVIQKGCPDGDHNKNWSIPDWASETYLWWVCSSQNAQPGAHIVKGIGRLRGQFLESAEHRLDGVVFSSPICGTPMRQCPKAHHSLVVDDAPVPPPCVFTVQGTGIGDDELTRHAGKDRVFPKLLMGLFGISDGSVETFIGQVDFSRRGQALKTLVEANYGPARSTTYRS